jgi:hypothetical protein
MNIEQSPSSLYIHQTQYVKQKLLEFGLANAAPASCPLNPRIHLRAATLGKVAELAKLNVNYRALIGSLNYLSILTRPGISFAVSVLSQHLKQPGIQHYWAAQQVFRYLAGTKHIGLTFSKSDSTQITAHVDADWGNCPYSRQSSTSYAILSNGHILSWKASRQTTVSLSSTKAEYKVLLDLGRELAWMASLMEEIRINYF